MKSGLVPILWCLMLMIGTSKNAVCAESSVSAKVEVDRAFATIGDRINFRVTVTHKPELTILEIDPTEVLRDFEIKESNSFSYKEKDKISEGKNYVLVNYTLGEYVIRPFKIAYRAKAGEVSQLMTNSLYITIQSIDKNKTPDSDIRGVKGVRKIKNPIWLWLFVLLPLTALGIGTWLYYTRKNQLQNQLAAEKVLLPHEEAYQALNRLRNSDLIRRGLVKIYFFQMSEILRRYFERRYRIRALESTTYELTKELKNKLQTDHFKLVDEVLTFCDLVKFAKYDPSPAEILRQNSQSKLIVDVTKEEVFPPVPETAKNET